MAIFRTEFAIDGVWYTNALRFTDPDQAHQAAVAKFHAWLVPLAYRVVPADHPEKEAFLGDDDATAFQTIFPAGYTTADLPPTYIQLAEIDALAARIEREAHLPASRADAASLLITLRARCDELQLPRPTQDELDEGVEVAHALLSQP